MRLRGGEMKMVRVRGIEGKRTFMERHLPMTLFFLKMELTKKIWGGKKWEGGKESHTVAKKKWVAG